MNVYENADVNTLILECRAHSDAAFDEMVRRYTPMMRKVIFSFPGVSVDFGVLFSEACVALHAAIQRYDIGQDEVTFGLYARICVYNRIVDLLRADDFSRNVVTDDIDQIDDGENVEAGVVRRETAERILECARSVLSDYEYRVFILHIQGYKTATIAKMLSRNAKSVDNAKARVFKRLRSIAD